MRRHIVDVAVHHAAQRCVTIALCATPNLPTNMNYPY